MIYSDASNGVFPSSFEKAWPDGACAKNESRANQPVANYGKRRRILN